MLEIKATKLYGPWATRFAKPWLHVMQAYQLAGLIQEEDTYFGAPKPGERIRGATGKGKVVAAMETPAEEPRFVGMRMVPQVSRKEIQPFQGGDQN